MKRNLSKGSYVAPRAYVVTAAPEGLICTVSFNVVDVQVDELRNIYYLEESTECFDFEV